MKQDYTAPEVEVFEVEIERGFCTSMENPRPGGNHDWESADWDWMF